MSRSVRFEVNDEDVAVPLRRRSGALRRVSVIVVLGLFLLLLLACPLPMGANRDWAWAPMAVMIGVLAILAALVQGPRDGQEADAEERKFLLLLVAGFVLIVAIALLQMSTFAPHTASARYYIEAAAILGHAHAPVPTLAIDESVATLLRCLATGLVFAIARTLFASQGRARLLLMTLVASALLVTAYGFASQTASNSCYLGSFLKKEGAFILANHCLMSGTFVNSNSFACFLGMALVAALGMVFEDRRARRRRRSDDDDAILEENPFMRWMSGRRIVLLALAFMFFGGLLISGSRAGLASTIIGVFLLGILLMRGRWKSRGQVGRAVLVAIFVAVAAAAVAGSAIVQKFSNLPSAESTNRLVIWGAAFDAIAQSPWLGWGLGSFNDINSVLQPDKIPQPNDKAHSTPIETFVELGIPGGLLAMAVVALPWWICLRGALQRRERYLPASAFAISAIPIVHSTVDFSLQMPAIAFFVSAFLGMGWAQAFVRQENRPRRFTN